MQIQIALTVAAAVIGSHGRCSGHGAPVNVDVASGRLTVSGGLTDSVGYANWIFADPDPETWLINGGEVQITDAPGFIIQGMTSADSLFLEIVPRPDFHEAGHLQRWLWRGGRTGAE